MTAPAPPSARLTRGLDRVFRTALFVVPFGVLANLALSWYATDHAVLATLGDRPRRWLFVALALALVPWFTNALRLLLWTRFVGRWLPYREALRITLGSDLAASIVPNSVREVVRWGMMVQNGVGKGQAASIVTLGYLEDACFFAIAIPTAVVLSRAWNLPVLQAMGGQLQGKALPAALLVAGVAAAAWLGARALLRGGLGARARRRGLRAAARTRRRFRRSWREYRGVLRLVRQRGKARFALTFAITAVQWSCRYSVLTALALFLGVRADPVLFFLLQWVIFTTMLFVPTPGASGGAEAAFMLVYSALLPAGLIGIATAGWRMLTFYVLLALGAVLFAGLNLAAVRGRRAAGDPAGGSVREAAA
ncbi:MAG TPA: lysylphosphatidylglycerol synthase transmembrane domain-containing protein [Longimicrobiaceae bacterium]|nr:lysylphosphatidylglycerol synthase transmembrane domain-containing protein [Longimicrobiaceae bacterium]